MQLSARIAQSLDECLFDVHVNVFEFRTKLHLAALDRRLDFQQRGFDLCRFVGSHKPLSGKHLSVRDRAANVMGIKAMIKADALAEGFQAFVRRSLKNPTARRCSGQS
jgi:hypothetical protein